MNVVLGDTPEARSSRRRIWREAVIAARFGLVGIAATATHILVLSILLSVTELPPLLANTVAFATAFGISFTGNYVWTFQSPGEPRRAMRRFLLVSGAAFTVNTLILAALLDSGWLAPRTATIVSAAVIPVITFLSSRLWSFRPSRKA